MRPSSGHVSRLVLGTAQLGMEYGIANSEGRPSLEKAVKIVSTAWEQGIQFFDTAKAYGDSERVLGQCFREILDRGEASDLAVISKLEPNADLSDVDRVLKDVDESLKNLGTDCLWGLMLHRESSLDQFGKPLREAVAKLKGSEKIKYFGITTYSPEKTIQALRMEEVDIVQFPFNVFDQRPLEHEYFRFGDEKGKQVFVRSVYLQGLLLIDPDHLPGKMAFSEEVLREYRDFSNKQPFPVRLISLAFVAQKASHARVVIGCESPHQVKENVDLFREAHAIDLPDLSFLSQKDLRIIDPSLWPQRDSSSRSMKKLTRGLQR